MNMNEKLLNMKKQLPLSMGPSFSATLYKISAVQNSAEKKNLKFSFNKVNMCEKTMGEMRTNLEFVRKVCQRRLVNAIPVDAIAK